MNHISSMQATQLFGDVLEQAPWGVIVCKDSGIIEIANSATSRILSKHFKWKQVERDLRNLPISKLLPGIDLEALGEQQIQATGEDSAALQIHVSKLEADDEPGIAVYIDPPDRRLKRERLLERQASTDELSDLANRRAFQRTIEAHQSRALSLALIDVDHFKKVNDEHGHVVGDDLIRLIGRLLTNYFSDTCILAARMGGDEFSVLFETSSADDFVALLQNFCQDLSSTKVSAVADLYATVSCGAVISLEPGIDSRRLLTVADRELYKAKNSGRNQLSWSMIDRKVDSQQSDSIDRDF